VRSYKSDGSVSQKSVTKLPQRLMLREFAKASEAEIWTSVHRRYFLSSAGLFFENVPGLTEIDAAEGRRNRWLYLKGSNENSRNTSDVIGQAKNRLCKTGQDLADKRPTLASIATKE